MEKKGRELTEEGDVEKEQKGGCKEKSYCSPQLSPSLSLCLGVRVYLDDHVLWPLCEVAPLLCHLILIQW